MKLKFFTFIIIFLLVPACSFLENNNIPMLRMKLSDLLNDNNFEQASNLFYYPNSLSDQEKKTKKDQLVNNLKLIKNTLGNIQPQNYPVPNSNYEIKISSLEREDFVNLKDLTGGTFPVLYSNALAGYLGIDVTESSIFRPNIVNITFELDSLSDQQLNEFEQNGIKVKRLYTSEQIKSRYPIVYEEIETVFNNINPDYPEISNYQTMINEILPFLENCNSQEELKIFIKKLRSIDLYEDKIKDAEFVEYVKKYEQLSGEIWKKWQAYKAQ